MLPLQNGMINVHMKELIAKNTIIESSNFKFGLSVGFSIDKINQLIFNND